MVLAAAALRCILFVHAQCRHGRRRTAQARESVNTYHSSHCYCPAGRGFWKLGLGEYFPSNIVTAATDPNSPGFTQAALESEGLATGIVTTANDPAPAGEVIGQSPAAGVAVVAGNAVDLTVSSGPVLVSVPDVFPWWMILFFFVEGERCWWGGRGKVLFRSFLEERESSQRERCEKKNLCDDEVH